MNLLQKYEKRVSKRLCLSYSLLIFLDTNYLVNSKFKKDILDKNSNFRFS